MSSTKEANAARSYCQVQSSLSACLDRVRQGDESAARDLVECMHPLVMKMIRSHLPARESKEDLEQKIFIKMFSKLHQYKAVVPFEHWLSRIAINTCLNQIRSEQSRKELRWSDLSAEQVDIIDTLSNTGTEPDSHHAASSRELIEKLLGCLNAQDRLLITLLYLEGHSGAEVQKLTGWNPVLIRVRAYRAKAHLRKQYAKLEKCHVQRRTST